MSLVRRRSIALAMATTQCDTVWSQLRISSNVNAQWWRHVPGRWRGRWVGTGVRPAGGAGGGVRLCVCGRVWVVMSRVFAGLLITAARAICATLLQ